MQKDKRSHYVPNTFIGFSYKNRTSLFKDMIAMLLNPSCLFPPKPATQYLPSCFAAYIPASGYGL
jgi:hypothetical protein